ncbi:MAG TPA: BtpA/SgcQ family protein [Candidatus Saccharimonadales bacterium]|nr:BtpA/SgcQ family protein [Candidatus Saccharimonadales bacterium]
MSSGFRALFGAPAAGRPLLIGVVHLRPLPGSPGWPPADAARADRDPLGAVLEAAVQDARALEAGGLRGVIVENFFDAPFFAEQVPAVTVAAMARCVAQVRRSVGLPVGVNVLRNDAAAALGIAAACGADFIRVNVHCGAMVTDQGLVQGRAAETLRLRRALGTPALIFADVLVKHASPAAPVDVVQAAEDTYHRGLADALLLTGAGTGKPAAPEDAARVRAALPEAPLLVASGVTQETVAAWLRACDGAVVGTWLKQGGELARPVDVDRVRRLVAAAR